jgi:hypothetical protein
VIPYEVDPSLHSTQPQEPVLDDGFSQPDKDEAHILPNGRKPAAEPVISEKSDF